MNWEQAGRAATLELMRPLRLFLLLLFPVWAEADTWFERQQQEEELERLKKEHDENVRRGREQAVRPRCLCLSKQSNGQIDIHLSKAVLLCVWRHDGFGCMILVLANLSGLGHPLVAAVFCWERFSCMFCMAV